MKEIRTKFKREKRGKSSRNMKLKLQEIKCVKIT